MNEEGKKMKENLSVIKEKTKEAIGPNETSTTNFATLLEVRKRDGIQKRNYFFVMASFIALLYGSYVC